MANQYLQRRKKSNDPSVQARTSAAFQDNRALSSLVTQRVNEEDEESVTQRQANRTGLPDNLKNTMENISGLSLDSVNVHYNSAKPAAAQAHAFAQGSDIYIAPGQERHLPHELWHVVQQAQGRVAATSTVNGMQVNDDPSLEQEATDLGKQAMQNN